MWYDHTLTTACQYFVNNNPKKVHPFCQFSLSSPLSFYLAIHCIPLSSGSFWAVKFEKVFLNFHFTSSSIDLLGSQILNFHLNLHNWLFDILIAILQWESIPGFWLSLNLEKFFLGVRLDKGFFHYLVFVFFTLVLTSNYYILPVWLQFYYLSRSWVTYLFTLHNITSYS